MVKIEVVVVHSRGNLMKTTKKCKNAYYRQERVTLNSSKKEILNLKQALIKKSRKFLLAE
jgi:hypothetical protein